MHDRIPPSLAWLVKCRRGIAGRLQAAQEDQARWAKQAGAAESVIDRQRELLDKAHRKLRAVEIEIAALTRDVAALDQTIQLHRIPVDPTKLGATRIHRSPRRSAWGHMTASIYKALAEAAPKALTTDQVAAFVVANCEFGSAPETYEEVRYKIRKRLQRLVRDGRVLRLHARYSGAHETGLWCQPAHAEQRHW